MRCLLCRDPRSSVLTPPTSRDVSGQECRPTSAHSSVSSQIHHIAEPCLTSLNSFLAPGYISMVNRTWIANELTADSFPGHPCRSWHCSGLCWASILAAGSSRHHSGKSNEVSTLERMVNVCQQCECKLILLPVRARLHQPRGILYWRLALPVLQLASKHSDRLCGDARRLLRFNGFGSSRR